MKEFLQSIFKTTQERVKNPFIGAFMTSWIVFNWKPILYFIFSSKDIEEKMKFIDENFSKINHLLWLPLSTAIFYVLILPYLSLLFDILLKYSLLKRNDIVISKQKQNIENQKQLAIEEIKLEEAKTDYRERNTHNKLVEDLQKRNKELEIEIQSEKESNRSMIEGLKSELTSKEKMMHEELRNFEQRYTESRKEISQLNNKLFEKDKEIQTLKVLLSDTELNNSNKISRSLIIFQNGLRVVERFDGNRITYENSETNEQYSEQEIKMLMEKYSYDKIDNA
jgi:hypothetical protein